MSNALHDYARLFERYAANNGGTGAILAGEDCLALANEMRMDADAIDVENAKLRNENAELRKLASDMRWCLNDKCSWCQKFGTSCSTERDRQKLGIEVEP